MSLTVVLQDEAGRPLGTVIDQRGTILALIEGGGGPGKRLLEGIDPYGDAVFNRLQMETFLDEWATMMERPESREERELLLAVAQLAEKCRNGMHLYLKFVGD